MNQYQKYLQVIKKSIGSKKYRHFYVVKNGKKIDVLKSGRLSCAYYLSSILKEFNLIWKVHQTISVTLWDMRLHGWRRTKKLTPGSILYWEKRKGPNGWHEHIGFYLGEDKAISHRGEVRVPILHHYTYGLTKDGKPKRKIIKILTHRMIKKGVRDVKEIAWVIVKDKKLKIQYTDVLGKKQEKEFKIIARKEKLTNFKNPYWKGGPCPPGEYYLFHRQKNDKKGNRIELSQRKPKKLIQREHYVWGINILNPFKKANVLRFKNSPNRTNIQIHGGRKSKGCLVIEKAKEFEKDILFLFQRGINVKIKVDDYWKTKGGKKEII